ncbi:isochorismate synthase [Kurthia sibirica]|uniref:isochorismate synthase n=1 Tax=Kurthia sibirica TaxID=202750 RepID=A0A2U3AJX2_9BACL|nr:isochorismate synthase [Kurthia sibirica]PWI24801.1 isochorismate synthase [Kurthia sibirica]GEK35577.1 isochorismate synthase MenF [Kurthia sibirica]
MNRKLSTTNDDPSKKDQSTVHFFIDTIEVERLSALAFFEAGEDAFDGKRFFWQNREKNFTLVGLGHAYTIESNEDESRYETVEQQWKALIAVSNYKDYPQQPILFGSYTFDPKKAVSNEWSHFSHAYFALATHQLVIRNEKMYVNSHIVSREAITVEDIKRCNAERDELLHKAQVRGSKSYAKLHVTSMMEPYKEEYLQSITQVTDKIKEGVAEKVVIARSLALEFSAEVTASNVLAQVYAEQPESYLFALEKEQNLFFGASPERLVLVKDNKAYSSCIAGSIKRGATKEMDDQLGQSLLNDAKNLQEHQYVVEMISQSFKENCINYTVPTAPQLLRIRDIQHLYTPVEGDLNEGATILQMVANLHPTPALGGSPRGKAMDMIRDYEPMNRGLYAGPIGWMNAEGDGEFAVAIRSALLQQKKAFLYAGGGIVADSEAMSEYDETLVKFRPMLRALGGQLNDD